MNYRLIDTLKPYTLHELFQGYETVALAAIGFGTLGVYLGVRSAQRTIERVERQTSFPNRW